MDFNIIRSRYRPWTRIQGMRIKYGWLVINTWLRIGKPKIPLKITDWGSYYDDRGWCYKLLYKDPNQTAVITKICERWGVKPDPKSGNVSTVGHTEAELLNLIQATLEVQAYRNFKERGWIVDEIS